MMKSILKIKKLLIPVIIIGLLFFNQNYVFAGEVYQSVDQIILDGHKATATEAFGPTNTLKGNPVSLQGIYLKIFLSFLGVIFLILIIYAGFSWMRAAGNEETAKKAKATMVDASIGLAVVLAAYAIASYVIDRLVETTVVAG
jgi:cytochrome bd-type quinol oxidase subunit 2